MHPDPTRSLIRSERTMPSTPLKSLAPGSWCWSGSSPLSQRALSSPMGYRPVPQSPGARAVD